MRTRAISFFLPALLLPALAGCGGASRGPAQALAYTDPADAGQWRLATDPASTGRHLVLDLLAPAGASGMGVTLVLTVDTRFAQWSPVAGTALVQPGGYMGPLAQAASVQGADLRILLSQEPPTAPVAYAATPVLAVALDLVPGVAPGNVALTAANGGHLAASATLPVPIEPAIGALKAK